MKVIRVLIGLLVAALLLPTPAAATAASGSVSDPAGDAPGLASADSATTTEPTSEISDIYVYQVFGAGLQCGRPPPC